MNTKPFDGKLIFHHPVNKETVYGDIIDPVSLNPENTINIVINPDGDGYAEWKVRECELHVVLNLWFDANKLIDFDGAIDLPKQLIDCLIERGYDMTYAMPL